MSDGIHDEELMARIVREDEEAFRILIERHQDRVYGTVARIARTSFPAAPVVPAR